MSGCSSRCAPGCRCGDFSSKAEQLPSLVSIEVVTDILEQAVRNVARRCDAVARGEMSPQEIEEANEKLVDWMGVTFSGGNGHFATGEDWNPRGLAIYVRDMLAEQIKEVQGVIPEDDEELINAAAAVFLADLYKILNDLTQAGYQLEGVERAPQAVRLINFWSRLLTGAPSEALFH